MSRNAVLLLMYNTTVPQLELSKLAFESIISQDIGELEIILCDNGSSPETGTPAWTDSLGAEVNGHTVTVRRTEINQSPVDISNSTLADVFSRGYDKMLSVPNDVILPKNLYTQLSRWPRGIVTAHMSWSDPVDLIQDHVAVALHEDPHLSVALVRKWAHDSLVAQYGYFYDPEYFLYVSDLDLKLRMAACGIRGVQTDIRCWHYGSACWRLGTPESGAAVNSRANRDRNYFAQKWKGALAGRAPEDAMKDVNFLG